MNTAELGDLGLTPDEEAALVAFLRTLSDGYAETSMAASTVGLTELRLPVAGE